MEENILVSLLIAYFVLSLVSLYLTEKLCHVSKLGVARQAGLYLLSLVALGVAWGLSQVFIALAIIGPILGMFIGARFIAKLSVKNSFIFAACDTVVLAGLGFIAYELISHIFV